MKDYLKIHASQAEYETWLASTNFVTPNVSAITGSSDVFYNPKVTTPSGYNMLDILWSDGTTTTTVRPTTDGVTPIGLCVAPTGFFGANEKARFMALKYAGGSALGNIGSATGSTTYNDQYLYWSGKAKKEVTGLPNYNQIVSNNQNNVVQIADYQGNIIGSAFDGAGEPIMLYTENNTWIGLEPNNPFTNCALGDINGKQNINIISTLDSLSYNSYYYSFASVRLYYTPGTQAGDWYLPALGELALIAANQSRINTVLNSISSLYSSDCMSNIYGDRNYWSSTERNLDRAFSIRFSNAVMSIGTDKLLNNLVIPMLQK